MLVRKIQTTPLGQPSLVPAISNPPAHSARALQGLLMGHFDEGPEVDGLPELEGISLIDRIDSIASLVSRFAGVALFFAALALLVYALI